jgi:hypothetical protein
MVMDVDGDAMARDGPYGLREFLLDVISVYEKAEPVWLSDHYNSWAPSDDDDPKQYQEKEGDSING